MRKNYRISIRVTKEEREAIKKKAEILGFDNLTSFVKWCTKEKIFLIGKMQKSLNGSKN